MNQNILAIVIVKFKFSPKKFKSKHVSTNKGLKMDSVVNELFRSVIKIKGSFKVKTSFPNFSRPLFKINNAK